ncbi:MAG: O-antigen ligase family protein [Actinobacteria bacterium]|nr:O-antigen ligase family protein [Actinomycetota bacterium]
MAFFYYLKLILPTTTALPYVIHTLIFVVYIISAFNIKGGLYVFIFLLPVINSLPIIIIGKHYHIILFLFFALLLGFVVNYSGRIYDGNWFRHRSGLVFEADITKLLVLFTVIFTISTAITIYRYSNFYPFLTNNYHDLALNVDGAGSTDSIKWTLRFFFNYFTGIMLFAIVFMVLDKIRDIIKAIIVLMSSTFLSSLFAIYQYFFHPGLGNSRHWVNSGRFNGTFTDPNSLGAYVMLIFPLIVALIIFYKRWYQRLILAVFFVFFAVMVFISGSRSAFVGIGLSLLIFLVFFIRWLAGFLRGRTKNASRLKKTMILVVFIVLVLAVISGAVYTFMNEDSFLARASLVERTVDTVNTGIYHFKKYGLAEGLKSISNYRYILWGQAIAMTKDYPLSGVGMGAYNIELPNYFVKNRTGGIDTDFTGNYYLQISSELGLPGLITVLMVFFLMIRKVSLYFIWKKRTGAGYHKDNDGSSSIVTTGRQGLGAGYHKDNSEPPSIATAGRRGLSKGDYNDNNDWLLTGLFVSFISFLVGQFFGPHTNFIEIQFTFWLIMGLMLAFVRTGQREFLVKYGQGMNSGQAAGSAHVIKPAPLLLSRRIRFTLREKISGAFIILLFTVAFSVSSLTDLSINVNQNLYDIKGNHKGWTNNYGLYEEVTLDGETFRWSAGDASEVVEKKGSTIVIPMRDKIPIEVKKPLLVNVYVDNMPVKKAIIKLDEWTEVKFEIPDMARERFTLTFKFSRSWVPREVGLNMDTRELGAQIGPFEFSD